MPNLLEPKASIICTFMFFSTIQFSAKVYLPWFNFQCKNTVQTIILIKHINNTSVQG